MVLKELHLEPKEYAVTCSNNCSLLQFVVVYGGWQEIKTGEK
jgi:hypothetical protein